MKKTENVVLVSIIAFLTPLLLMTVYLMFVILPVMFYTESECLSKGYPRAHVTIGLDRYCSNFDGAVTVKVTKQ